MLGLASAAFSIPRVTMRPRQKSRSTVTAITARLAVAVTISSMDGDSVKHLCPSCGRRMGLTRTIAAGEGYTEMHTYGCRECGVWVTEGSTPRDQLKDTFLVANGLVL